jgi:hypothetical protein
MRISLVKQVEGEAAAPRILLFVALGQRLQDAAGRAKNFGDSGRA